VKKLLALFVVALALVSMTSVVGCSGKETKTATSEKK
jgi:hypothetical protein